MKMKMKMNRSILFSIFVSFAVGQQRGWDDNYGRNNNNFNDDNNLYAAYAARQEEKVAFVNNGGGLQGWPKLLIAGVGGYFVGGWKKSRSMPKLRLKLKQRVECNMGGKWVKGQIIKLWFNLDHAGQYVPYQILLDDGTKIYAPADTEQIIRAATTTKKRKKKK